MSKAPDHPSREDVLDAFAIEPNPGRETLERYLRAYPAFATQLVDLWRELSRNPCEDEAPLSADDEKKIDAAWRRHRESTPGAATDPFASLSALELREVARRLDVPRQVITAFREGRVILSTVPRRFWGRLADATNSAIDLLIPTLPPRAALSPTRSYKADDKPLSKQVVSFERILIEAGVPEEKRAQLLADAD